MPLLFREAFQVIPSRTELTADQRPTLTALKTGIDINMAETLWLRVMDLQVPVTDHVPISKQFAASNEAGTFVKSQWTMDALHQLRRDRQRRMKSVTMGALGAIV